jgi:Ni,Fe-hydrogenase maturation factor
MTEKNTVIIGIGNLILRDEGLGVHGEVAIIGVEPMEISWEMGLSPGVEATVPKVIDAVFEDLT